MDIQRIKAAKCQIANVPKLSIAGVADLKYTTRVQRETEK
jgi:hypothetical protein